MTTADLKYVAFGWYAPPKAEQLLEAFSKARIRFRLECDDGNSIPSWILCAIASLGTTNSNRWRRKNSAATVGHRSC